MEHPLTRPILPLIPTSIRDIFMSNEEAARLLNEYEGAGEYLKLLAEGVGGKIRGRATRPKPSQQTGSPSSQPKRITIKDVSRDLEVLNVSKKKRIWLRRRKKRSRRSGGETNVPFFYLRNSYRQMTVLPNGHITP